MPFGVQLVHNQLIRFHGNNCQMVNQHIIRHFGHHPGFRNFLLFFLFSFLKTSVNCKNKILDAKLKKKSQNYIFNKLTVLKAKTILHK